ncbi:MAG: hypothetical protein LOD91_10535 [Limnochordales bacterium]|nr:hypothetical protein [Limnochordales bacterium]
MQEREAGRQPADSHEVPIAGTTAAPSGGGGAAAGTVRTPLGTMVLVLIYAAATVVLWAYVYYHMLRYGGGLGGH